MEPTFNKCCCCSLRTGCIILSILGILGYAAFVYDSTETIRNLNRELEEFKEFCSIREHYCPRLPSAKKSVSTQQIILRCHIGVGTLNLAANILILIGAVLEYPKFIYPILVTIPMTILYDIIVAIVIWIQIGESERYITVGIFVKLAISLAFTIPIWYVIFSYVQHLKEEETRNQIIRVQPFEELNM